MNRSTPSRLSALIMAARNRQAASCALGPSSASARAMRAVCSPASFIASASPLAREIEEALAPVVGARLLQHIALVDELLEHAAERLLGDLEDVEQFGDLHARIAVDEMQHPVVRAAEAEFLQHVVGIADEVAIGEEQKLDDVPEPARPRAPQARPVGAWRSAASGAVRSAILTYFGQIVTHEPARTKGSCAGHHPERCAGGASAL